MDAELEGGEPEEADESDVDVELDQEEVADAKEAMDKVMSVLDKLMGGAAPEMGDEMAPEMGDEMAPEMDMEVDAEIEPTEDEIVQEVARRVAKRINEAARAQKKANRLLGRK